eukprot:185641-Prorocentrum_minimum.AAC.1
MKDRGQNQTFQWRKLLLSKVVNEKSLGKLNFSVFSVAKALIRGLDGRVEPYPKSSPSPPKVSVHSVVP